MEGLRATVGADDPLTLGAMNNLAQLYGRQGRLTDAEAVQREVLAAQRRVQGETHPHTLGSMLNLAELCESLGKRAEAEELLRAALDGFRRAHGPEHPGTLLAPSNLAMLQSAMGRQEEAERLQRSALDVRLRILGEGHPDTIGTYANLGLILARQQRFGDAETMYTRAWELGLKHLGETHPTTVSAALGLTTAYESQGWPERSRETTARLLTVIRALGASPTATPNTLNNCAWLLLTVEPADLRAPAAALGFAELAVSHARENRDPSLWMYLDTLALAQAGTGDYAAAAATQREAIALIPPHGEQHRGELEQRLAEYEGAVGRE